MRDVSARKHQESKRCPLKRNVCSMLSGVLSRVLYVECIEERAVSCKVHALKSVGRVYSKHKRIAELLREMIVTVYVGRKSNKRKIISAPRSTVPCRAP